MLIDCCGHPWLHMEAPRDGPNSESDTTQARKTSVANVETTSMEAGVMHSDKRPLAIMISARFMGTLR